MKIMGAMFENIVSFQKARWVLPRLDEEQVRVMIQRHGLPDMVARLLCARGIAIDAVEDFLNPTLRRNFPDPGTMAGMTAAAAFVARTVQDRRRMAIFGDFDVDGATSSALLHRFFKALGLDVPFYIPDRLTEGYGPNIDALSKLKGEGAEIVILADCGTTAFDTVAQARAIGLDIVILDHHEAEDRLPDATHIVNPKRRDCASGLSMLAACGVSFMFCVAVNRALREDGFFTAANLPEPQVKSWLDLVALGTVCDMVPLTGINRLFVRTGFQLMASTQNAGLKALIEVSRVTGAPTPYHAGFALGPRINAGSRVHQADLGARLLAADDPEEAKNIAWTLNDCNDKRRELQAVMMQEAVGKVEAGRLDRFAAIIVEDKGWHPGLAGLVAGRLKEKYGKPACVVTYAEDGAGRVLARGSGRSVPGVNIATAFIDARAAGLLINGGGHAMAGGFTLDPARLDEFRAFVADHIARQSASLGANIDTRLDGIMTVRGLKPEFARMLQENVGPFGQGNPEPLFVIPQARLHSADVVGDGHIRAMIGDWEGGARMKAMAFRAMDTPLGQALLKQGREPFHLAGHIKLDTWNGQERVEMHIQDGAPAMAGDAAAGRFKTA